MYRYHLEELFQLLARSFSQLEMVRLAKAGNVIVKLDTGAGKTFVASMLMQHMLPQTKASLSEGGKRIVFLVKTGKNDNPNSNCFQKNWIFKYAEYG